MNFVPWIILQPLIRFTREICNTFELRVIKFLIKIQFKINFVKKIVIQEILLTHCLLLVSLIKVVFQLFLPNWDCDPRHQCFSCIGAFIRREYFSMNLGDAACRISNLIIHKLLVRPLNVILIFSFYYGNFIFYVMLCFTGLWVLAFCLNKIKMLQTIPDTHNQTLWTSRCLKKKIFLGIYI